VAMRKYPRQARSRETVTAIIEAAARILGKRGWARFTTNEVAELAGVSIGSLYQYFSNKAALVEAVRRRHFDHLLAATQTADEEVRAPGLEERLERLVYGLIAAHSIEPSLHRVLLEEVPRPSSSYHDAFKTEYLRRYKMILARGSDESRADMVVRILSAAMEGVVHDAARNGGLESPSLARELVVLACAYLRESDSTR
ncbi:MAG: TetR/AcrR family transcriptional regulator, partial [Candidatus Cybelea sp.]